MRHLRYWIVALALWLFALYNLERWNEPINVASFVYVYAIICISIVLIVPWFQRLPLYWIFLIVLPPYFFLTVYFGYPLELGSHLPLTVTEICALGISILLARQVGCRLEEFREGVAELTLERVDGDAHSFEKGQGRIYREIRRARLYDRPATLMALAASDESMQKSLNRFIAEAQHEMIVKFVYAHVARLLADELPECDIIARRNEHLVVLLPEVGNERASEIADSLRIAGKEKLGLDFDIGLSTFPGEAVTFERLLEKAEAAMRGSPVELAAEHEQSSALVRDVLGEDGINIEVADSAAP